MLKHCDWFLLSLLSFIKKIKIKTPEVIQVRNVCCPVTRTPGHHYARQVNIVSIWKETWITAVVLLGCHLTSLHALSWLRFKGAETKKNPESFMSAPASQAPCSDLGQAAGDAWVRCTPREPLAGSLFYSIDEQTAKTTLMTFHGEQHLSTCWGCWDFDYSSHR